LTLLARDVEAATEALERLACLRVLTAAVAAAEREATAAARAALQLWSAIGASLGISKQAASQRIRPQQDDAAPESPDAGKVSPGEHRGARSRRSWHVTTLGGRTLLKVVRR
jgi:hypothetical protein